MTEQHPEVDESVHEIPDEAPADGAPPPAEDVPAPPETGDLVIDAALGDLAAAPAEDLDAQLASGEAVQRTLQSRLSDLGG